MATPFKALVLRVPLRPAGSLATTTTRCCTTAARPLSFGGSSILQQQPKLLSRSPIQQQLRLNSTAASPASASSAGASSAAAEPKLDWNSFFKLRLRRRRIQVVFSVATGAAGLVGGVVLLATGLADPLVSQVPLDPFITLGLMTVTCAGAGWLVGPSIGAQVFYLLNRSLKNQINRKEADFFARIRKNRVDPSNSSAANPVPDFYGEKIQSVHGYRQWLKDQRAFNKKKAADLI